MPFLNDSKPLLPLPKHELIKGNIGGSYGRVLIMMNLKNQN